MRLSLVSNGELLARPPDRCDDIAQVTSDLIDEHRFLFNSSLSYSASIVGCISFISKFSQSLAPMLGYSLFGRSNDSNVSDPESLLRVIWFALLSVPAACVAMQFVLWKWNYSLYGPYLKRIQVALQEDHQFQQLVV